MQTTQEKINRHVGSRLRAIRESSGLSQAELADKIGRELDIVKLNEDGKRRISADELWQLCAILDVGPSSFFVGLD